MILVIIWKNKKISEDKDAENRKYQHFKVSKILPKSYYHSLSILTQFCNRDQGQIQNIKNKI